MKAMIFAAGLGTRLKPWTDHHPKALALVNGKSLLQRNIEYLQQFGIDEVIVNVHHFADQVREAIERNRGWDSKITISDETDAVLETGGGLKKAAWYFQASKNFVVMNVDILTNMDLGAMILQHQSATALATLAVSARETSRYFLFNEEGVLKGWRNVKTGEEKPASLSTMKGYASLQARAFSGMHVISSDLLSLMQQQGKFSMVDVYLELMGQHRIESFDHTGTGMLIDVGKPESIASAEMIFQ